MKGRISSLYGIGFCINLMVAVLLFFIFANKLLVALYSSFILLANILYLLFLNKQPALVSAVVGAINLVAAPIYGIPAFLGIRTTCKAIKLHAVEIASNKEASAKPVVFYIRTMYLLYIAISLFVFTTLAVLSLPFIELDSIVILVAIYSASIVFFILFFLNINKVGFAHDDQKMFFRPAATLALYQVAIEDVLNISVNNDEYIFFIQIDHEVINFALARSDFNIAEQAELEQHLHELEKVVTRNHS